jgi:manganese efflux pump family protein
MGLVTITIIAVGLAMDAFAVSIVSGAACRKLKVRHALRIAIFFGGFQALMPLVGSLAGLVIKELISGYDHWIAFALLTAVGGKMIYESLTFKPAARNFNPENIFVLLALSLATSVDALAVGVTLSLLVTSVATAVIIIGLVTFVLSYLGVWIGKKIGHFFEAAIEALGGLVLIAIGLKILVQHSLF